MQSIARFTERSRALLLIGETGSALTRPEPRIDLIFAPGNGVGPELQPLGKLPSVFQAIKVAPAERDALAAIEVLEPEHTHGVTVSLQQCNLYAGKRRTSIRSTVFLQNCKERHSLRFEDRGGEIMTSQSMRDWSREFAREIGLSADEVYGRQRALAESGLLLHEQRRGKGGGIAANPTNIARAMIAILFADRRSAVEQYGRHYINMPILQSPSNPPINANTFGEAVSSLISKPKSAENLSYIGCYRTHYFGEIGIKSLGVTYKTTFGYGTLSSYSFGILAWLDGSSVHWSAQRYAGHIGGQCDP